MTKSGMNDWTNVAGPLLVITLLLVFVMAVAWIAVEAVSDALAERMEIEARIVEVFPSHAFNQPNRTLFELDDGTRVWRRGLYGIRHETVVITVRKDNVDKGGGLSP